MSARTSARRGSGLPGTKRFAAALLCLGALAPIEAGAASRGETVTIVNDTGANQTVYFMITHPIISKTGNPTLRAQVVTTFNALTYPCQFPSSPYSGNGNDETCHFVLPSGKFQAMPLSMLPAGQVSLAISAGKNHFPEGPCNTTLAEITLNQEGNDAYDISLVNGRSFDMKLEVNTMMLANTAGASIVLDSSSDPKTTLGVYPIGCSACVDGQGVAPAWKGNGSTTQNCPGYGRPPGPMPAGSCKTGTQFNPQPNACEIDSVPTGGTYTVTFEPAQTGLD